MKLPYYYVIALGSNRPVGRRATPHAVLRDVIDGWPAREAGTLLAQSTIIGSLPLGKGRRRYANAAILIETDHPPMPLLERLKAIERDFGRKRGRRWGDRPLDLDIILWSGGKIRSRRLNIPHPAWRSRAFVLAPVAAIAPHWRDPVTRQTARQLYRRHNRR